MPRPAPTQHGLQVVQGSMGSAVDRGTCRPTAWDGQGMPGPAQHPATNKSLRPASHLHISWQRVHHACIVQLLQQDP